MSIILYPYLYKELEKPEKMIELLFDQYLNKKFVIENNILTRFYNNYETDAISSHFTEELRSKCHQGKNPNFIEMWDKTPKNIWKKFQKTDDIRLYLMKNGAKECNFFNPALGIHLYLDYIDKKPIKILDPSAGWGDRMIAAIACGDFVESYHGFDPEPTLSSKYDEIISRLDITKKCSYETKPFEDASLIKGYYDLAMTSPPYWDLEIYSNHSDQSTSKYLTYESWSKNFYTKYLINMKYGVRIGGVIIVYVSDYSLKGVKYELEKLTIEILEKNGAKLRLKGGLRSSEKGYIRPFFIFDVIDN